MIKKIALFVLATGSYYGVAQSNDHAPHFSDEAAYNQINPKMVWGPVTNFVRSGLYGGVLHTQLRAAINVSNGLVILTGNDHRAASPVKLCLENYAGPPASTFPTTYQQGVPMTSVPYTNWVFVYLPPANERFELDLIDAQGAAVARTDLGKEVGRALTLKPMTTADKFEKNYHTRRVGLLPKEVVEIPLFDRKVFTRDGAASALYNIEPAKYFEIKEAGFYKLTVVGRVYVTDTNSYLKAIDLPPVVIDVHVIK